MKAVVCNTYGSPEVLQLEEVPLPVPKDDEVLVKIHAASINSWDWDFLAGKPYIYRLIFGLFKPRFKTLGCDIAGCVEAIGKNVKHLKPGDEVLGDVSECNWGGFAEYTCASASVLSLKPAGLSFEIAAAIPQAGVLALQGLRYAGEISVGQKILINGAGGGVGTFALQMAKMYGAEVTCVDSIDKLAMLRSIGADHVTDYSQEDFTKEEAAYDLILDVVSKRSVFSYTRALKPGGTCVIIGGAISSLLQTALLGSLQAVFSKKKVALLMHKPNTKDLDFIAQLVVNGKIKPIIDKVFALSETASAFKHFGEGRVKGKVVIKT